MYVPIGRYKISPLSLTPTFNALAWLKSKTLPGSRRLDQSHGAIPFRKNKRAHIFCSLDHRGVLNRSNQGRI